LIGKKYNDILRNLEKNIESTRDLNLAKSALADLSVSYADELTKINQNYITKVGNFETRLSDLEKKFIDTEIGEIHLSETISCPYCNFNFSVEYDDTNQEITCPKCNNLIELDWGDFEDDM